MLRSIVFAVVAILASVAEATPTLYGMSVVRRQLVTVDVETGHLTDVGEPTACVQDIAFNVLDGYLYGYDCGTTPALIRIDPTTAEWEDVGTPLAFGGLHGMAYDSIRRQLFATTITGDRLLAVDPLTGEAVIVGDMERRIASLAFDPLAETLFGVTWSGDKLLQIDRDTAAVTLIGDVTGHGLGVEGLAFDPDYRLLYAVFIRDPWSDSVLATIDPITASVTEIGAIGSNDFISGLDFAPEPSTLFILALAGAYAFRRSRGSWR